MARSYWLLPIALIAAIVLLVGFRSPSRNSVETASTFPLRVDPAELDFGTVLASPDFQWTIRVSNTSNSQVIVDRFATSCNCTSVDPPQLSLVPGESKPITLHVDLTRANREPSLTGKPFRVRIAPRLRDSNLMHAWFVAGRVRSPLLLIPRDGHVAIEDPSPGVRFDIRAADDIAGLSVQAAPEWLREFRVEPQQEQRRFLLSARVPRQTEQARLVGTVRFRAGLESGATIDQDVPVELTVAHHVRVTPTAVLFGVVGEAGAAQLVRVSSRLDHPFRVVDASSSHPGIRVEHTAGSRATYRIAVQNPPDGQTKAEVRFLVESADANGQTQRFVVELPVSCYASEEE